MEAATPSRELVKVPLQKGVFKTLPNNPKRKDGSTHCYCPPEQVDSEMENLIRMHTEHEAAGVPPDVEAAWLHHRFTQIHPFQDGNGRIARALASLIFIKAGWFPVVIRRDQRDNYISCLEKADEGSLESLAKLFASIQKLAFIQALSLSQTVLKEAQSVSDLIKSGIDRLRTRFEEKAQNLARVFEFSSELEGICLARFGIVAGELQSQLVELDSNYEAAAFSSRESNHHFYHTQILDLAREFEYYAI